MLEWRKIREAIDACRPGSDDLAAPEMQDVARQIDADPAARSLLEQTQREDKVIAQAFQQVGIPVGLEQRLLAALLAAEPIDDVARADVATAPVEEGVEAAPPGPRVWRRVFIGAVAASLMLAVGLAVWNRQPPLGASRLAPLVLQWIKDVEQFEEGRWQAFQREDFPQLRWVPQRWASLPTELDEKAVVFDFPLRDGRRLLLFQFRSSRPVTLPPVPFQSLPATGRWSLGAWEENGVVFVAVSSDPQLLKNAFRPPRAT
jgi:hypothetical protein